MTAEMMLVGGGARSGKSRFAFERALRAGNKRAFVATAVAFDEEMQARIASHQHERQATFETIEAPTGLASVAGQMGHFDVILLDCLTVYVSNLLLAIADIETLTTSDMHRVEVECVRDVQSGLVVLRERCQSLIVVTNEVGQGVVPVARLGRIFRDIAGRINQAVAASAQQVWLCAFGLPLCLKPSLSHQNPID